jgi:CubicO group peptidase (beta-lactamase class C family)
MAKATKFETLNGFPRETITLANWRTRPYSFWAFRNVAEMVRSARIRTAAPSPLPAKVDSRDLLARPASPGASQPVADLLRSSQADSFLLSRNGRLVCEWHADGVDRSDPHLVFSISKSITALVAGILEDQGLLDPSTPVGKLVPEAGNSAYADATVQHLLDMRVSLDFDESYLSQLDYARYRRAMSWNPPIAGRRRRGHAFLPVQPSKGPGHPMAATTPISRPTRTCSASCWNGSAASVSRICAPGFSGSRSAQRPMPSSPSIPKARRALPAASPAGRMICWRWARCWSMAARINGRPNRLGTLDRRHANKRRRGAGRAAPRPDFLKTGRYRNNWYQVGGGSNAFLAAGIHGQFLYCDPDTGTVIACTSSQHEPQTDGLDQALLAMFAALCREL